MTDLIVIRGGGDLATGVIQAFHRSGLPLLVLEVANPTAIRRTVALCETVYEGCATVEDVTCEKIEHLSQIADCHQRGTVPLLVDSVGACLEELRPTAVIDAIIAKKNLGTNRILAPITVALGPGFTAGVDVDIVIETMRGHDLGRLIFEGTARPNTGIPGELGGRSAERVVHAPCEGIVRPKKQIGDVVQAGELILTVEETPVYAPFTGLLRGLIREGLWVSQRMKIADIDPRTGIDWHTISDKARTLGGATLTAYFYAKGGNGI